MSWQSTKLPMEGGAGVEPTVSPVPRVCFPANTSRPCGAPLPHCAPGELFSFGASGGKEDKETLRAIHALGCRVLCHAAQRQIMQLPPS